MQGGWGVLVHRQQTCQLCFPTLKNDGAQFRSQTVSPVAEHQLVVGAQPYDNTSSAGTEHLSYTTNRFGAEAGLIRYRVRIQPVKHIMKYEGSLSVRRVSHRHNCYRRDYSKTISPIFPRVFMSHTRQQGGQSYVSDSDTRSTQLCVHIVPRRFNSHEDYSKKVFMLFCKSPFSRPSSCNLCIMRTPQYNRGVDTQ